MVHKSLNPMLQGWVRSCLVLDPCEEAAPPLVLGVESRREAARLVAELDGRHEGCLNI